MENNQTSRSKMDSKIKEAPQASVRKKMRRERRRLVVGELIKDFGQNTTLHGLRYVAEKRLSLTEKIFWIASFVTSLSLCAMLIWNVWEKWQSMPIIVSQSDNLIPVEDVPLPSITICPNLKVKKSFMSDARLLNLSRKYFFNYNDADTEDILMYEAVFLVIGHSNRLSQRKFDAKIIENIFAMSPTLKEVVVHCEMFGLPTYEPIFFPVLTMEGVCFTMNTLSSSEILRQDRIQNNFAYLHSTRKSQNWSLTGYSSRFDPEISESESVYPRRGKRKSIAREDVLIVLGHVQENQSDTIMNSDGFKVYLHHPADLPQSSVSFYEASSKCIISMGLRLKITNTSSSLRSYSPDTRRCYFPGERQLRYFLAYTENNCRLECTANHTLKRCGCVWFHMPHNETSTICRPSKWKCAEKAIKYSENMQNYFDQSEGCRCYPLCVNVQYEADIKEVKKEFKEQKSFSLETPYEYTEIYLFYKAPKFVAMHRSELFGLTDFMANCGGLLGLFFGFSFLSLVEIVYFCTLRLGCSFCRNTQQGENKTVNNEERY